MPDTETRLLSAVSAVAAVVLGAALVVAAGSPFAEPLSDSLRLAVALATFVASLVLAYGWPTLLGLPSPRGVRTVLAGSAAACSLAGVVGEGRDLRWLSVALAITVVGSFLHQLLRRDGRARLVTTLGGTALGTGLIACGACYVAVADQWGGGLLIAVTVAAVAVSGIVDLALHRTPHGEWALPISMALGALVGALLSLAGDDVKVVPAFALGVAAAGVSHGVRRVLTLLPSARWRSAQAAVGAAAVLSGGALAYVASWIIVR